VSTATIGNEAETTETTTETKGKLFYDATVRWVLMVVKAMGLTPERIALVMGNHKTYEFSLRYQLDRDAAAGNDVCQTVPGALVLWWHGISKQRPTSLGFKGGTRFDMVADLWEAMALSFLMMFKNALLGLPFYGGKCAIQVDPHSLSATERERLDLAYAAKLIELGVAGPNGYVTASDMGTGEFDMDVICRGMEHVFGDRAGACVTGKSEACPGRTVSTGYFAALTAVWEADQLGIPNDQRSAIIQGGLGKVGYWAMYYLHKWGWHITGITERVNGRVVAVKSHKGLDPERLRDYTGQDRSRLTSYGDVEVITETEFLQLDVTAVVLAAMELAVGVAEATIIGAGVVVGAANGGVTVDGDAVLTDRGRRHSSILSSSGGVVVSWLEWLLGLGEYGEGLTDGQLPSEEQVLERARLVLKRGYDEKSAVLVRFPALTPGMADLAVAIVAILKQHGCDLMAPAS
jgi:glutamate dehydrogenase/leucine dehydrogenase